MRRRISPWCGLLMVALATACADDITTAPAASAIRPLLDLSAAAAGPISFCNPATITINQSGAATPYPSQITVSGIPSGPFRVTATLNGISHGVPADVDILLVGPGGQNVVLMSDARGSADMQNITLTFDDNAAAQLPETGALPGGTFKPTNLGSGDFFQGLTGPFGATFAVFAGTDPNGAWKLYLWDDTFFEAGSIANGWCVNITALTSVPVANAGGPYTVIEGAPLTFDGTGSTDAGNDIVSYAWNFGDGATGTGPTPEHTYEIMGSYTVTLLVTDAEGATDNSTASVTVPNAPGTPETFCNLAPITVRDATSAIPFPSTITLSGIASGSFKVTATVRRITHPLLSDLEMLLVGPGGQTVMLMSDAASVLNQSRNITLTFDDDATSPIQQGLPDLQSGTYKPTNYGDSDPIPGGEPAGPYGRSFAGFAGTDANGVWKLYVWDDAASFVRSIDNGWCVNITSLNSAPLANAGGPYSGAEGSPIAFDGTSSTDPDNNIASYAWDFGDGKTGSGSIVDHTYENGGTYTVTLVVTDADGASSSATATVTVDHVAPTATFNAPTDVSEGSVATISLTSPSAADARYAFDCGSGYGAIGTAPGAACQTADNGPITVKGKVVDATDDDLFTEYTAQVDVTNVAPTATFTHNGPLSEGAAIQLQLGNVVDVAADLAGLTFAFDCGSGYGPPGAAATTSCPTTDNGDAEAKGKVIDKDGGETEYRATVSVGNVAPVVTSVSLPPDPVAVNTPVTLGAAFTDAGTGDSHTGSFELGAGGSVVPGSVAEASGSGSMSASFSFAQAGVHTIIARVTDDDGGTGSRSSGLDVPAFVVVYDPTGSFVTGGGWIDSPAGAYAPEPTFAGKASFGFVARYKPGAITPSGNTEFQFKAGGLNFKSTSYDWLVVAAAHAKYKGVGTINGGGSYGFMITAVDGDRQDGADADEFRIKIWKLASGEVVYDNKMGEADESQAATSLGGGSIVIHK